jgi:hypothetical protein
VTRGRHHSNLMPDTMIMGQGMWHTASSAAVAEEASVLAAAQSKEHCLDLAKAKDSTGRTSTGGNGTIKEKEEKAMEILTFASPFNPFTDS